MEFKGMKVSESFKAKDLEKVPLTKIIDFIPWIEVCDVWVLKKWMSFFQGKNIPFIVTEDKRRAGRGAGFTLWKEQRI